MTYLIRSSPILFITVLVKTSTKYYSITRTKNKKYIKISALKSLLRHYMYITAKLFKSTKSKNMANSGGKV